MDIFILLVVLIFIYFYYIRKTDSEESFANNFRTDNFSNNVGKMDNFDKETKLYISFTTIPSRIIYVDEMLKSVDVPEVYEIHLNLQNEFEYPEKEIERLKSMTPKLKIYKIDEKLGPLCKIVPTLERLLGTNSLVMSVDDDFIYSHQHIINMVKSTTYNEVVGSNSFDFSRVRVLNEKKFNYINNNFNIFQGFAGMLYPMNIVTQQMIDDMKQIALLSRRCYKSDDIAINTILKKYNINKKDIKRWPGKELHYSKTDGLHSARHDPRFSNSNIENYYYCCNDIIDNKIL